jgi:hypothetical protein
MKARISKPTRPTWYADNWDMHELLGLPRGGRLPVEGMPERLIQGVRVYVKPLIGERPVRGNPLFGQRLRRGKRNGHRVIAICGCGQHVSAGRLHQHKCEKLTAVRKAIERLESQHEQRVHPCKYGHLGCAIVEGGLCFDEHMGRLESQLPKEVA